MTGKLNIAFIWHQHQPYYKVRQADGRSLYHLPWVRLHAVKDYYDIPNYLKQYPAIKQNFNLVPSLLEQIRDYTENRATDHIIDLTLRSPEDLSEKEHAEVLDLFFMANYERMIIPQPRYRQLLQKKLDREAFSRQDIMDLQVWYNLCWVGEHWKNEEPFASLIAKGQAFTEADKSLVLEGHYALMAEVIPLYRDLAASGQIELSVTPFYHPILPLLCDSAIARLSDDRYIEPEIRFRHPEDAAHQIGRAFDYFQELFGYRPRGMWPSEGSVSEEACGLMRSAGAEWIATDQEILYRSDVNDSRRDILLPHVLRTDHGDLLILFRDHTLSDLIGFSYAYKPPEKAAEDFIRRLESVRELLVVDGKNPERYLLPIILDGENCWEYYEQNGKPFLHALYQRLSRSESLATQTVSGFIDAAGSNGAERPHLTRLHPGSWINHNFRIWIGGHPEENTAWKYLKTTRDFLAQAEKERRLPEAIIRAAWEEIYIAEGSDWFWWFGDDHWAYNKHRFDDLFRHHLIRVYELMEAPAPPELHQPIMAADRRAQAIRMPTGVITPKIDGQQNHHYEWRLAGVYEASLDSDTMNVSDAWIEKIYFGFDMHYLYLRIDFYERKIDYFKQADGLSLEIHFQKEEPLTVRFHKYYCETTLNKPFQCEYIFEDVFEAAIPLSALDYASHENMVFYAVIKNGDFEIVRRPSRQPVEIEIPDDSIDQYLWSV